MSENQPNDDGGKSTPPVVDPPRDNSGKFTPKPKAPITPEPTPDPPKDENNTSVNSLLVEIEKELKESLKGQVPLDDIEGIENQDTRIRMLRILAKTIKKSEKDQSIDPLQTPPVSEYVYVPIGEENRVDKFRADMRQKNSYLNTMKKIRSRDQ